MTPKTAIVILAAGAMAPAASLWAQDPPPLAERTAQTDLPLEGARGAMQLEHVGLSFAIDPTRKAISGNGQYRVRSNQMLGELVFDLDSRYRLNMIRLDDEALENERWSNADGLLAIELQQPLPAGEMTSRGLPQPYRERAATCSGPVSTIPRIASARLTCGSPCRLG